MQFCYLNTIFFWFFVFRKEIESKAIPREVSKFYQRNVQESVASKQEILQQIRNSSPKDFSSAIKFLYELKERVLKENVNDVQKSFRTKNVQGKNDNYNKIQEKEEVKLILNMKRLGFIAMSKQGCMPYFSKLLEQDTKMALASLKWEASLKESLFMNVKTFTNNWDSFAKGMILNQKSINIVGVDGNNSLLKQGSIFVNNCYRNFVGRVAYQKSI